MLKCSISFSLSKKELGYRGEKYVASCLVNKGYTLLAQNYRYHHKEIDIVACKQKRLLILEVKTRPMAYLKTHLNWYQLFTQLQKVRTYQAVRHFLLENKYQLNYSAILYWGIVVAQAGRRFKVVKVLPLFSTF